MVINIMLSRLYLGVHSIYDVFAGAGFGILTILIYESAFLKAQMTKWENSITLYYYILTFVILICFMVWKNESFPLLLLLSIGTLSGYGIAYIYFQYNTCLELNKTQKTLSIIMNFIILLFFYKTFLVLKSSLLLFNTLILLKFALLPIWIYVLLPLLEKEIFRSWKEKLN